MKKTFIRFSIFSLICFSLTNCRTGQKIQTGVLIPIELKQFEPCEASVWGFPHISRLKSDTVIRFWIQREFEPLEILTIAKYENEFYCEYVTYGIDHKHYFWTKRKSRPIETYNQIELIPLQGWKEFTQSLDSLNIYRITSSEEIDYSKFTVCSPTFYTVETLIKDSISFANFYSVQPFKYESSTMDYYQKIVDLLNISFIPFSEKLAADRKKYEFNLKYENESNR
ncbi:hypothetical protein ACE1ET_20450 [Saccharicrinis sp. FJH62]|uniref:hypothetical protein n=1 Tax=Saccharicrinis sp. FJH62 TaxID=3344657 RepID=UPI0035D42321